MSEQPLLSMVITCYTLDRLKGIFELLDSIKVQTYPHVETIVVVEKVNELYDQINGYATEKSLSQLRVIFNQGEQGASAARNLAIKEAKGGIIGFVDDDVVLSPHWVEEAIKTYQDDSVIGVAGPADALWECTPAKWMPEEFYWIIGCTGWLQAKEIKEIRNVWTMNSSFRREVFDKGVLFSTTIGPNGGSMKGRERNKISEDLEFSIRAKEKTGKRIVFNPEVKVRHRVTVDRLSWRYIIKWSYWIGTSRRTLNRLYPRNKRQSSIVDTEQQLLRRIFTRLLPDIIKGVFTNPLIACRKFILTITVLSCISFGYLLSPILKR